MNLENIKEFADAVVRHGKLNEITIDPKIGDDPSDVKYEKDIVRLLRADNLDIDKTKSYNNYHDGDIIYNGEYIELKETYNERDGVGLSFLMFIKDNYGNRLGYQHDAIVIFNNSFTSYYIVSADKLFKLLYTRNSTNLVNNNYNKWRNDNPYVSLPHDKNTPMRIHRNYLHYTKLEPNNGYWLTYSAPFDYGIGWEDAVVYSSIEK